MRQTGAGGARGFRDRARAEILNHVEFLLPGLEQDRHEVDDGIGALDSPVNGPPVAQIRLNGLNLPDIAERLQMARQIGSPARDTHPIAPPGKRPDRMAADESRSAEDRDEP